MSVRLYIGNLSRELQREDFEAFFAEENDNVVSIKLITDRKTGKCRGFGFVTVKSDEVADALVEKYNGQELQGATLKVEKAMPRDKEEGSGDSGGRSRPNNKRGGRGNSSSNYSSPASEVAQPDPRWASDLEKLKEMLAAQATPS